MTLQENDLILLDYQLYRKIILEESEDATIELEDSIPLGSRVLRLEDSIP
jgi:hypothetical protein